MNILSLFDNSDDSMYNSYLHFHLLDVWRVSLCQVVFANAWHGVMMHHLCATFFSNYLLQIQKSVLTLSLRCLFHTVTGLITVLLAFSILMINSQDYNWTEPSKP